MQTGLLTLAARLASVPVLSDIATLAARLLVASLFVPEGWGKINGYADTQSYMAQFGVEPRLLPLVIALEFGGGLLLALGGATRPLALALGILAVGGADFPPGRRLQRGARVPQGLRHRRRALRSRCARRRRVVARRLVRASSHAGARARSS